MNKVSKLLAGYEAQLGLEWEKGLHGGEKTWFAIYDPADERRIRAFLGEFELGTLSVGKKWLHYDVTDSFETWLAKSEYREEYFQDPDFLEMQYQDFEQDLVRKLKESCQKSDEETVFAITGVGSLFGFVRVSHLVGGLEDSVKGRLLVFFPGSVEANTYRLLNARDGWNYRAVAIVASR